MATAPQRWAVVHPRDGFVRSLDEDLPRDAAQESIAAENHGRKRGDRLSLVPLARCTLMVMGAAVNGSTITLTSSTKPSSSVNGFSWTPSVRTLSLSVLSPPGDAAP